MKIKSLGVFIIFLVFTGFSYAQDLGSEMVEVVKPYTPTVSDAFKIKETPKISDSVNLEKRPVQYSIFSVPVASTFTPAKGRATTVERQRPPKLFDNYITLGFGTYTSALAEFYSNIEVTRTDNFGIFLTHNSAQGGIDGVELDDHYYDTELNLNYSSRKRNLIWNTDFGVEHRLFNWYGVRSDEVSQEVINNLEPQHNYYSVYAGGEINWEKSFFDRAEAKYRYFGDDFESTEHRLTFKPTLEIPIGGELFHTNLIFDYLNGSFAPYFDDGEDLTYSYMNLGVASSLLILRDDLTLNLGAAIYYSYDSENSDSGIYVYPQVTASYRAAGDYFIAYAGLEGELRQNSYYEFTKENPFLSPAVDIAPTDQQYNAYVGAKGKLSTNIGYNTRLKYMAEDYKPLFRSNPNEMTEPGTKPEYAYGNSFGVVYDQVNTISLFGELDFDVNSDFNLRVNGEFFVYDTSNEEEAWNLPTFRANLIGDYQITEKWFAGANVFFVGERKDFEIYQTSDVLNSVRTVIVSLDSYFDLNLNLGYRFNDRLSIFARGQNLLGDNYERWVDYPVLGMQVMAGATYKFDFGR
ncbi:TonB-dependent receptor [Salinimicrobium sp. MT39]|uniref:TonB-dependent receptor n=1 Tax=Salinimicrobium profundisediminis TaxID=2994553 RepID=A0A9X3CX74_9FLAO|nr:TonB-dependent receptor [Salinimicrobium profundisediminis]MCX2838622.1 TonB-dependent receptor [Salinimicrobium profundisediminis]